MDPKQTASRLGCNAMSNICRILSRRKELIALLSVVALISAILVWFCWPLPCQSEAPLLIKYVKDTRPPELMAEGEAQMTSPDSNGENTINSEIEILTSQDLVNTVVEVLSPGRILAKAGGGTNRLEAGHLVKSGFTAGVAMKSDVINLVFSGPDPEMVQPILSQIIGSYLKGHADIHRPEFNEFLIRETDTVKGKLQETESALRDAKTRAGIVSLDDNKKSLEEMTLKIQQKLYDADVELAVCQRTIKARRDLLANPAGSTAPTNPPSLPTADPAASLNEEIIKGEALEARIQVLTNQLAEVGRKAGAVNGQEGVILQLTRDKEPEEAEFSFYSRRLKESRAFEALGAGDANISVVESPTPAVRDMRSSPE